MRYFIIDATTSTTVAVAKENDDLYEAAKAMLRHTFLVVRPDATNLPDELLGEVVEATDMFFPSGEKEPLFEVDGYDEAIPMSALALA